MRRMNWFGVVSFVLLTAACAAQSARAASLSWAVGGLYPPTGTAGTWTGASNWYDGTAYKNWATSRDAYFGGTGGSVTLTAGTSVGNMTFISDGYVIGNSTLWPYYLVGTTPIITVTTGYGHDL